MEFKVGQLVIYKGADGYEIGKIKRFKDKENAFIWYTSGDTAALTHLSLVKPLINDYAVQDLLNKE